MSITAQQLTGQNQSHILWLNKNVGVHKQMHPAFKAMTLAAENDGLTLTIASGFRDFERQLTIWNNKFTGKFPVKDRNNNIVEMKALSDKGKIDAILLFSALPDKYTHHFITFCSNH